MEEEQKKKILAITLKVFWTSLILIVFFSIFVPLAVYVWPDVIIFAFLGIILATSLVIGWTIFAEDKLASKIMISLSGFAAILATFYYSNAAVKNLETLKTYNKCYIPFFSSLALGFLTVLFIKIVWVEKAEEKAEGATREKEETIEQ